MLINWPAEIKLARPVISGPDAFTVGAAGPAREILPVSGLLHNSQLCIGYEAGKHGETKGGYEVVSGSVTRGGINSGQLLIYFNRVIL
jgi:hypothetical protein